MKLNSMPMMARIGETVHNYFKIPNTSLSFLIVKKIQNVEKHPF
jgi:hypothetical protein